MVGFVGALFYSCAVAYKPIKRGQKSAFFQLISDIGGDDNLLTKYTHPQSHNIQPSNTNYGC